MPTSPSAPLGTSTGHAWLRTRAPPNTPPPNQPISNLKSQISNLKSPPRAEGSGLLGESLLSLRAEHACQPPPTRPSPNTPLGALSPSSAFSVQAPGTQGSVLALSQPAPSPNKPAAGSALLGKSQLSLCAPSAPTRSPHTPFSEPAPFYNLLFTISNPPPPTHHYSPHFAYSLPISTTMRAGRSRHAPRASGRKSTAKPSLRASRPNTQRGRACEGAEISQQSSRRPCQPCFNGAAPVRARKSVSESVFSGSASTLQRGRACEGAVMTALTVLASRIVRASTGPRL